MRIDFSPRLQYGIGENPTGGMASAALGATPYGAIAQAGLGIIQGIGGYFQQKKAIKELERMQSPTYNPNKSILDYYNKSLAKYQVDPRQTDLYRMQEQQANRGLSSGLGALGSRGMALGGVSTLVQNRNDSLLKAGAEAEQLSRQDLSRVGQGAGMLAQEQGKEFEINKQQPFERKYNLKALKAGGGTSIMNAGLANLGKAANTYDQYKLTDKIYG